MQVTVDGVPVDLDPSGLDGWFFSNRLNGELSLVGSACDQLIRAPQLPVRATVACD